MKPQAPSPQPLLVLAALVLGCAVFVSGCGYSLAGRGDFLPDYIKSIGIPQFANRTTVYNLETQLTQKVVSEFIGRGKYRIVPEETGVDAILVGEIVAAQFDTIAVNTTQMLAQGKAVRVTARIELRDVHENKVIWQNAALTYREEYSAQSGNAANDPNAFFAQDANALERLSTGFAHAIVNEILQAF